MKTHNWQTKALTLFIAAAALWLATACAEDSGIRIITPSAPCGDYYGERRLMPSVEFQHFPGRYGTGDHRIDSQDWNRAAMARNERLRSEDERGRAILEKYDYLYHENSGWVYSDGHVFGWSLRSPDTETGLPTDQFVINVNVNVHPSMLKPRIPECLDGVPVIFQYHPDFGEPLEFYP